MRPPKQTHKTFMTVCIAAIAAKSQAIVCIADRALTFSSLTASAQTDSGVTKIVDIPGTRWCAMFSGDDMAFPERVLGIVAGEIAKDGKAECTRPRMELIVKAAFEACWKREVEDQVLKPKVLDFAAFTADPKDVRLLNADYLSKLSEEIAEYKHTCAMLFCGFDSAGPHILLANTPCRIDPCDWQGFQAIGAGEETARNHLIWSEFDKDDGLAAVLYDVFNAKVATEVIQGIGYAWDWRVIVSGRKPKPIPRDIDRLINRVWEALNQSPYADGPAKKVPKDWKKKLAEFAKKLLLDLSTT